jgi:hypothetical protein
MNFYSKFRNDQYNNNDERDRLLTFIIRDCNQFNEVEADLINIEKEIAIFSTENCKSCYNKSVNDNIDWSHFCDKLNFRCSTECELILIQNRKLDKNEDNNLLKQFVDLKKQWINQKKIVGKCYQSFKTSFIQQKSYLIDLKDNIISLKKINSILVFKKQYISFLINIIQISIILISSLITFFESIKENLSLNSLIIKIISITASTYIAFILALFRFFKLDTINENIGKVIERYSFIINRLQDKYKTINTFDFKKETVSYWNETINKYKKESIKDIITKTNQEKDILITLKEIVYYQKIYIQLKLKKEIDRANFKKAIIYAKNINSAEDLKKLKSIRKIKYCPLNICKCFKYKLDFNPLYKKENKNIELNDNIEENIVNINDYS